MTLTEMEIDPYANDPGRWGVSLAILADILFPCLETIAPRSVAEVGAYAGDLTLLLARRGEVAGWRTIAIDPSPQEQLRELDGELSNLELIEKPSLDALQTIPLPDAIILDGDHNYYTVSQELRLIGERAFSEGRKPPLVILHDVGWPHARRDTYYAPERIPPDQRQPLVEGAGLYPGVSGVRPGGLPYAWAAATEGGPRNGVLTAAEDFVEARENLRLVVVPAFFGLGFVWELDSPWADELAEILDFWDRNPLLARLEENRVMQLARFHFQSVEAARQARRNAEKDQLMIHLVQSRAFALAERLSKWHRRGKPAFSRAEIHRLLSEN